MFSNSRIGRAEESRVSRVACQPRVKWIFDYYMDGNLQIAMQSYTILPNKVFFHWALLSRYDNVSQSTRSLEVS